MIAQQDRFEGIAWNVEKGKHFWHPCLVPQSNKHTHLHAQLFSHQSCQSVLFVALDLWNLRPEPCLASRKWGDDVCHIPPLSSEKVGRKIVNWDARGQSTLTVKLIPPHLEGFARTVLAVLPRLIASYVRLLRHKNIRLWKICIFVMLTCSYHHWAHTFYQCSCKADLSCLSM